MIDLVCYFIKKILIYIKKSYWFIIDLGNIVKFIKEIQNSNYNIF